MRGRTAILIIITLAAMPVLALADGSAKAIVRRMVEADQRNWKLARTLEFSERVDSRRLDSEGKLKSKEVTIYDVLLVEGSPYRRLASRNDLALAATDAEKERRKFNQSLFERKRESARQRAMRVTEYESRPEWQRELWRELPDAFDFQQLGDQVDNYVIDALPHTGFRPKSRTAEVLIHLRVKLWINKQDLHLVKAEVEAMEPIWVGMFLVRLAKGSHAVFELSKVDGEIWMPQRIQISASLRLGLLKTLNIVQETQYGKVNNLLARTD